MIPVINLDQFTLTVIDYHQLWPDFIFASSNTGVQLLKLFGACELEYRDNCVYMCY